MREIKFRGKRKDNNEWIEGNLFIPNGLINGTYISPETTLANFAPDFEGECSLNEFMKQGHGCALGHFHEVMPETVGQFAGIKDKNGKSIYEGDILDGFANGSNQDRPYQGVVAWQTEQCGFIIRCGKYVLEFISLAMHGDGKESYLSKFEIKGNYHDNPELLP
jgi:uncharacterized phage protein (TIGR01671 family)